MYKYIFNPNTKKKINIKSKIGKITLYKYLSALKGGAERVSIETSINEKIKDVLLHKRIKKDWWISELIELEKLEIKGKMSPEEKIAEMRVNLAKPHVNLHDRARDMGVTDDDLRNYIVGLASSRKLDSLPSADEVKAITIDLIVQKVIENKQFITSENSAISMLLLSKDKREELDISVKEFSDIHNASAFMLLNYAPAKFNQSQNSISILCNCLIDLPILNMMKDLIKTIIPMGEIKDLKNTENILMHKFYFTEITKFIDTSNKELLNHLIDCEKNVKGLFDALVAEGIVDDSVKFSKINLDRLKNNDINKYFIRMYAITHILSVNILKSPRVVFRDLEEVLMNTTVDTAADLYRVEKFLKNIDMDEYKPIKKLFKDFFRRIEQLRDRLIRTNLALNEAILQQITTPSAGPPSHKRRPKKNKKNKDKVDGSSALEEDTVDRPSVLVEDTVDGPTVLEEDTVDGPSVLEEDTVEGPSVLEEDTVEGPLVSERSAFAESTATSSDDDTDDEEPSSQKVVRLKAEKIKDNFSKINEECERIKSQLEKLDLDIIDDLLLDDLIKTIESLSDEDGNGLIKKYNADLKDLRLRLQRPFTEWNIWIRDTILEDIGEESTFVGPEIPTKEALSREILEFKLVYIERFKEFLNRKFIADLNTMRGLIDRVYQIDDDQKVEPKDLDYLEKNFPDTWKYIQELSNFVEKQETFIDSVFVPAREQKDTTRFFLVEKHINNEDLSKLVPHIFSSHPNLPKENIVLIDGGNFLSDRNISQYQSEYDTWNKKLDTKVKERLRTFYVVIKEESLKRNGKIEEWFRHIYGKIINVFSLQSIQLILVIIHVNKYKLFKRNSIDGEVKPDPNDANHKKKFCEIYNSSGRPINGESHEACGYDDMLVRAMSEWDSVSSKFLKMNDSRKLLTGETRGGLGNPDLIGLAEILFNRFFKGGELDFKVGIYKIDDEPNASSARAKLYPSEFHRSK